MLDNKGYRHTRGICGVYCFSVAIMITFRLPDLNVYTHVARLVLWVSCFVGDYVGSSKMALVTCVRVRIGNLPDRSPACIGRVNKVPCSVCLPE
jgi:hypothetical protein